MAIHWAFVVGKPIASIRGIMTIYKDRQGGQWVYWVDTEEGRWFVQPEHVERYLRQGYRLVELGR